MQGPTFDAYLVAQAAASPDALAVADARRQATYRQLDELVSQLARGITGLDLAPAPRVALIADNSVGHLAAAFAVWRAGGTLVTIYPSSTASEIELALGDSDPALVLAGTRVIGDVRRAAARLALDVRELADGGIVGLPASARRERARIEPGALALICYTSGSTARPKAVMHSHAGLVAAARAYADVWHLGPADVTLVSLPLAWAYGLVTTSMATLTAGGRVVLAARSDPRLLLSMLADHAVTFFAGVTTVFVKLVDELERVGAAPPTNLRLCISGGEPRNEAAFGRWQALTGCPVHDVYAASECFPVVTYDPRRDPQPVPGSAGRVVPGAALRVIAPGGTEVVDGSPGEAWTRGPATMLGYWNDPELTTSVLTADGWYRTGDLVEVDGEGYVRVVGRLSDVIIRGGANVSPAEVEAVLARHPSVAEVAVVGVPHDVYGQEVVAAIVPRAGIETLDVDALAAHCAGSLADFKRPTRYVAVANLARNANTGKVQRRQIAAQLGPHAATP